MLLVVLLEGNLALLAGLLDGDALVRVRGGVHDDGGKEHEVPKGSDGARSEHGLVVGRRRGDEVRPGRLVRVGADQFLHEAHGCIDWCDRTRRKRTQQWYTGGWRYVGRTWSRFYIIRW